MESSNILLVLKPFINFLEELSVPYYIGGSIASSIFGMPRSTMDIDIIADIQKNHIPHLMEQLKNDYYIDENMIKEAIQHSTSFNIVHLETAMKVDVFIKKNNSYGNRSLERKLKKSLTEDMENTQFNFASPEDIILNKLKWYKIGNKVSERQWLDVLGVIKVQQNSLDIEYMKKWSKQLGIFGLLIKAFKESEIPL